MRKHPTATGAPVKSLEESRNPIPKQHKPAQDTRVPPLGEEREVVGLGDLSPDMWQAAGVREGPPAT
eukprot:226222-Prymnesium_polylepis.1